MTTEPAIEMLSFEGCPHAPTARENIRAAVEQAYGEQRVWVEWDLADPSTPAHLKRYGSPTVLVAGRDVTGEEPENQALACSALGAPTVEMIVAYLRRPEPRGHPAPPSPPPLQPPRS